MKSKQVILAFIFSIVAFNANAILEIKHNNQDVVTATITGTYDGYDEDDGYAFVVPDEEGDDETMYFAEIAEDVLKAVNLQSNDMMGKRFEITYEITEYEEEDENGFTEIYEVYKIVKLKKL
ncbi:hypothetical protein [Winogradskyella sp. MIT101101]|uniref:hypothetical protein n=1 Tax=Winogradskyella sp. MIT101101 TaxID=3098297 RepID=UPI00399BF6A5